MKQLICVLLAALMLLVLFTGCASSQREQTLPGIPPATETQEMRLQKAKEDYEIPERFTGEWTGLEDTYFVKADADILLPEDISKLCTAKVKRHAFTQEEADKVMEVFLKGNPLYENIYATKESLQEQLEHYEAIQRGEIPYEHDGTIDRVPGIIEGLKKNIETAPHEGEKFLADMKYHPEKLAEGVVRYGGNPDKRVIQGYAEVDGRILQCSFHNSGGDDWDYIKVWEEGFGETPSRAAGITGESLNDIFNQRTVPAAGREREVQVGDDLITALGLEEYTRDQIYAVSYASENGEATGEEGLLLEYVRKVNGLPLTKTNFNGDASEENVEYIGSWGYERLQVYVLEDRVVCFSWENPYEVTDVQTAGELQAFRNIQEVFEKMIFVKNHFWLEANKVNDFDILHDVKIDKVQLTLMRICPKDSVTEGTIIPVWDFWGSEIGRAGDKEHESLVHSEERYGVQLTLNALDGTLVDREIGY